MPHGNCREYMMYMVATSHTGPSPQCFASWSVAESYNNLSLFWEGKSADWGMFLLCWLCLLILTLIFRNYPPPPDPTKLVCGSSITSTRSMSLSLSVATMALAFSCGGELFNQSGGSNQMVLYPGTHLKRSHGLHWRREDLLAFTSS